MKKLLLTIALSISFSVSVLAMNSGGTVYVKVNGLVCDFCAQAIDKVFDKQEAVKSIHVDLDSKVITIHFNKDRQLDDETITRLIKDSGYDVRKIRRGMKEKTGSM